MHIRKAKMPALILESEAFVVDAKEVKNGGMEIVHMDAIFGHIVGIIIRGSVGYPRLYTASCKPGGKISGVMVPSEVVLVELPLTVIGATKFSSPDYQGVLEQTPLLKVSHQGVRCPVGFGALFFDSPGQGTMLVPAFVIELDKTDIFLG